MANRPQSPLLADLTRRESAIVARLGTTLTVSIGRQLTVQGHRGRQFGILVSGALRVVRDGREIARLTPGDCFGEIALIAGAHTATTATVEATEDSEIRVFSRSEFDELCTLVPTVAHRIHLVGLRRLARRPVAA